MAEEIAMFNMLAEKVMHKAINPAYLAYCPTMDLIAVATSDEQVHVYRLSGQRVFGISGKHPESKVRGLKWKPDGQLLAVAFDTGSISLVNTHTGKPVHQTKRSKSSKARICCLGWELNFTDARGSLGLEKNVAINDILAQHAPNMVSGTLDLPTDLAFLEIEVLLPRLSTLPVGGRDDEVFGTKSSLEAVLYPSQTSSNDVADVLIECFNDGTIHISIYDFFEIGTFDIRQPLQKLEGIQFLLHDAHPYSSTHSLLASSPCNSDAWLYYVPLDLRMLSTNGRYLSLLASRSTQLYNTLRYMQQVQYQMYSEFKAAQDLPRRFIRNIEETLQEKMYCSWVHAAYHLVVTGNCYPSVKEWLVDELGERGHKRWDKAVTSGYENIRRLAHEHLLPALERFSVLASRLRGLSKFQDYTDSLGLSKLELDDLLDTVSCLQLLAHHIVIISGSELRQFVAFSAWLRQEIDTQASDSTSTTVDETSDRDSTFDYAAILEYIQGAMLHSRLIELFNIQDESDVRPQLDLSSEGRFVYQSYKKEMKTFAEDEVVGKKLPGLNWLILRLETQCNVIFNSIAAAQRRQVRIGSPILLQKSDTLHCDMKVLVEANSVNVPMTYIATTPKMLQSIVKVYKITLEVKSGISSAAALECISIQCPHEEVKDVKFVDEDMLMVALCGNSSSRLLVLPYKNLPYQQLTEESIAKEYLEYMANAFTATLDLSDEGRIRQYVQHNFPQGLAWTPAKLEINGRKGRRILCVLAEDRLQYRVYDLDSSSSNESAAEGHVNPKEGRRDDSIRISR